MAQSAFPLMGFLLIIGALALLTFAVEGCRIVIGGASNFIQVGPAVTKAFGPTAGAYDVTSSLLGISNFNLGVYCIGVSDNPMTVLQDVQGVSRTPGKLTIPLVISSYGFFTPAIAGVIKLTPKQLYDIFSQPSLRVWSKYTTLIKGPITVLKRSDGSGSTFLIRKFWKSSIGTTTQPYNEQPFTFPGLVPVKGTVGICTKGKATPGSLSYAQVSVCVAVGGLTEIAVLNRGGTYLQASAPAAVTQQAIPRVLPPRSASWSAVETVWQDGQYTPAIVSMEFIFIQRSGLLKLPKGIVAKNLAIFFNKNVYTYAKPYGFDPLPASITTANLAALNAIN